MSQGHVTGMICIECERRARPGVGADCPSCGAAGSLEIAYDLDLVARTLDRPSLERREPWLWRFRELLPIDELAELPSLQVGMTPVYGAPRLAAWAGLQGLWIKDEGRAPSGSLHDRAAALALTRADERGARALVALGHGAPASAFACFAACAGKAAVLLDPDDTDQALPPLFGARHFRVDGGPEAARRLRDEAAEKLRWLPCGGAERPWVLEGLKTLGLEIAEQLGARMPDWIALPLDEDGVAEAIEKGLREARALGLVTSVPRLLGVQAAGSATPSASAAVRRSRGATVTVSEAELEAAAAACASLAAVPTCPAAAAAVAGLKAAVSREILEPGETVLAVVAGRALLADPPARPAEQASGLAELEAAARRLGLVR